MTKPQLGDKYNLYEMHRNVLTSVGVDPGFGPSKFAIVVTQYLDGKIHIKYAEEFDRDTYTYSR